jgi:DNA repair exonuclease SbcCD ATPase subunit
MMFGKKKAERIRELETENAALQRALNASEQNYQKAINEVIESRGAKNQVEYLVRTIRDIDQELFNMSQRTDWLGMRPYFQKLCDGMTARKVAESNRIADILRPALIETYKPKDLADAPKKLPSR